MKKILILEDEMSIRDFIVFNFKTQSWSMFNIVDQIPFNEEQELMDLL